MNSKAQAFIWLSVMVAIFGMGLIYILVNEAYDKVDSNLGGNFTGSQYETTYTKINTIWDMWLPISLIGIIIWGIVSTMRRKDQYEI